MNERFKELAEQAKCYADENNAHYLQNPHWIETFEEKFAELIVRECTKAVMDGTKEGDHYAMRIENHFDNGTDGILHFGVEE